MRHSWQHPVSRNRSKTVQYSMGDTSRAGQPAKQGQDPSAPPTWCAIRALVRRFISCARVRFSSRCASRPCPARSVLGVRWVRRGEEASCKLAGEEGH